MKHLYRPQALVFSRCPGHVLPAKSYPIYLMPVVRVCLL